MPAITGTNGNDNLTGTSGSDTINPLLGRDTVDGLGDSDTLIVDYSSVPVDPYAGASLIAVPSVITSSGGSFGGSVNTVDGSNFVNFSNIEHLQVKLDFWHDVFILDGGALALGATVVLDGAGGTDTLEANLSALAAVDLTFDGTSTTASFGTIISFEVFKLNLTSGADHVTTGAGKDTLTGNGGDDVLNSGAGDDILNGGAGSNILNGGDGDDWITSSGIDTVNGGAGFGYDRWMGEYGASTENLVLTRDLAAGTGSLSNGTTLTGIEQVMYLTTGSGNDVFNFAVGEGGVYAAGAGDDTLNLNGNGFNSTLSADGAGAFRGNFSGDQFSGFEHINFVSSSFNDTISVDAAPLLAGATLSLNAAGGLDRLIIDFSAYASISFIIAADTSVTTPVPLTLSNFEVYQITSGAGADTITTGSGDDIIQANGGNDVINGAGGNDLLDGGAGADAMSGGTGNDIYILDDAADTAIENAGEGVDEVRTALASFSIAGLANVENLKGTGAAGQTLIGNELANAITGGAGNDSLIGGTGGDTLAGGLGNDSYHVDSFADAIVEQAGGGRDVVYASSSYALTAGAEVEILSTASLGAVTAIDLIGNAFGQEIYGNAGSNYLTGGGGVDYLVGLGGDDRYLITGAGDHVVESAGGGRDVIYVQASYTLQAGLEIEILSAVNQSAATPLNLVGNAFDQEIYGNAGANYLQGGGGNDYLVGLGGSDRYFVTGPGDHVVESVGGGARDVIYTPSDYVMIEGVEIEVLASSDQSGTGAQTLIGNGFGQEIYGNNGTNFLEGGGGADYLAGFGGDDAYVVDSADDYVAESALGGRDVVYAKVSYALAAGQAIEVLSTASTGGTAAIDLTGNEAGNALYGNAGANVLNGGAGADYLMGFGAADSFAFTTALGGGNVDTLADFVSGTDKVLLDDAVFTGLSLGALSANAFVTGTQAGDADDRIVYDSATGQLFFDADGNGAGAQVLFATLDGHPPLNAGDFTVI